MNVRWNGKSGVVAVANQSIGRESCVTSLAIPVESGACFGF